MNFDEWFEEIHSSKSGGLLLLFDRLLSELEVGIGDMFSDDFNGDISFCLNESLTLPDLCGRVLWPEKKPRDRFISWLSSYAEEWISIEVLEVWEIRNALVHEKTVDSCYCFCGPSLSDGINPTSTDFYFENLSDAYRKNLINLCFIISRIALGFYLKHHEKFDCLDRDFKANFYIYKKYADLKSVRVFAKSFFDRYFDELS